MDRSVCHDSRGFHRLHLVYSSARDGFAPMVMGILEGLAEQYEEHWEFAHIGSRDQSGVDTFSMHHIASTAAVDTRNAA